MKLIGYFAIAFAAITMVACQKSYNPPDLVINDSTGTGGSGGGGNTGGGGLLVKAETRTNGSTEGNTDLYEYDANKRLIRVTSTETDSSNKSSTIVYRYIRDAAGKIITIVTNGTPAGYPPTTDSLRVTVHYPAGSSNFDYAKYVVDFGSGLSMTDSTAYTYSGGTITAMQDYQRITGGPANAGTALQFVYGGNNMITEKIYVPNSSGGMDLVGSFGFEFDDKPIMLSAGNEAFLLGLDPLYCSKNNVKKVSSSVFTPVNVSFNYTYTYQYNANNQPISATIVESGTNKTMSSKFTYQ